MFKIGCHLSASKGFLAMGKEAVSIKANTFQFFTRNPRGGNAKEIDTCDIAMFMRYCEENGIGRILAHASYTMNLCSDKEGIQKFSIEMLSDDLARMEHLPGNLYNFHPGSHVGQGADAGIQLIADALNLVLTPEQSTTVLLETMAGKGSEIGGRFEELRSIIDKVKLNGKLGVCLDTCHVNDAGYDVTNHLDDVLCEFDKVIGLERLFAIHLNDSKNPFKSHKDRHEVIGGGTIGIDAIAKIINHKKLRGLPFLLETPNELDGYAKEIALLKTYRKPDLL
ncbi:MAG: deoxyribonuclease IV [Oscillospiraceae bacterium]|nr:deoxyribonuclease IV [Oscillospiraceae bacterium]